MASRWVTLSTLLFFTADVFALMSLAMPDWIVSYVGGETRLGLLYTCEKLNNKEQRCYVDMRHGVWFCTLAFVLNGCAFVTLTVLLWLMSLYNADTQRTHDAARKFGFTAMILFCFAAVIFPMGFNMEEIGGEPYQLPNNFQVGYSYIFFVLSLWMTVVSELFAAKVCVPHA